MAIVMTKAKLGLEDLYADATTHLVPTSTGHTRTVNGLASSGGFLLLAGGTLTGNLTVANKDLAVTGAGTLAVAGNSTFSAQVTCADQVTFSKPYGTAISVTAGDTSVKALLATGAVNLSGGVLANTLTVGGGGGATGNLKTDTLGTTGTYTAAGNISQTGGSSTLRALTVSTGGIAVTGNSSIIGSLTVSTTLGVTTTITGGTVIAGSPGAGAGETLRTETLYVSGDVNADGDIYLSTVSGLVAIVGPCTVGGALTVVSTLTHGEVAGDAKSIADGQTEIDLGSSLHVATSLSAKVTISSVANGHEGTLVEIVNKGTSQDIDIAAALVSNSGVAVTIATDTAAYFRYLGGYLFLEYKS